jgi:glycosyltransferase involved in cell wall biosynthesis
MPRPAVTVLVDTYNHERFIEEALVSVVEQDFPAAEMEILVVDDGSTDGTPEIVRKFAPRVRLLRKQNGGQASAFNFGIPEARGQIVAFLDGDDWWARNKLTRVAETMAADPSLGIVGHGIITVHRDGSRQSEVLRDGFCFRADTLEGALLLRLRKSLLGTSRMTVRAAVLRSIGLVPAQLTIEADEYLFTLGAVLSNVQILPDVLTYYRIHESNGFQISAGDTDRSRRKARILTALAAELEKTLDRVLIEPRAREALLQLVRAESTQANLVLDGGWPWQTASTEWTLYRVLRPSAPISHRVFKLSTLLMALILPPKLFYGWRSRAAGSRVFGRIRRKIFAGERPKHVDHVQFIGNLPR